MVVVADEDGSENRMELPLNDDGRLSLSTLGSAFPGAAGLKYRNPDTGAFRILKFILSLSDCNLTGWNYPLLLSCVQ